MKKLITLLLAITMGYAASACSSYITHSISGGTVTFTNHSTPPTHSGPMAVYGNWNFGDGHYATGYNATHTYTTSGTFAVTLIMEWMDSATSTYVCGDTTFDTVAVTIVPPTGVSGTVYRDTAHFVFDSLMVWLITYDSVTHIIAAVDSQRIAATSCASPYSFTGVTAGSYLVKAASYFGTTSSSGFVPTYHDSSLSWSTGRYVSVTSSSMTTGANIWMQYGTVISGAPGFIGGDVRYGAGKTTYTVGDPVAGLTIYLLNTSNKLVSRTVTDASGNYSFSVPYGTYTISPEKGGLKTTNWSSVTVSSAAKNMTSINFLENSTKIVPNPTAIPTVIATSNIAIYPNPAHGSISIQWNNTTAKNATISIVNVAGQQVLNTSVSINSTVSNLNIANLQPGVYFMNIQAGASNYNSQLTIK